MGEERMLKWFVFGHLPNEELRPVLELYATMARVLVDLIQPGPERTVALRHLLDSRDSAVRQAIEDRAPVAVG